MAHIREYIPVKEGDFDRWFENLARYMLAKCTTSPPVWDHIPQDRWAGLSDAYGSWHTAYARTRGPHTSVDTAVKKDEKKAALAVIRPFVNQYLRFPPVTNEDRADMGIRSRDTIPAPVPAPQAEPEADVVYPGKHLLELANIHAGAGPVRDSRSNFGVRIFWGVMGDPTSTDKFRLAVPPATGNDLPHSTFTRRKKYRFDFEGDSGKTVWFCLRYENEKGGKFGEGPFGPLFSAVVP
jgi:hypothetical protein